MRGTGRGYDSATMPMRPLSAPTAVFFIAFLARAISLWWFFPPNGWSDVGNGFELGSVAANMTAGRGFSSPFETGNTPTAWFMPAIPALWSLLFSAYGTFSRESLAVVYGMDAILAGATASCYVFLAREMLPKDCPAWLPVLAALAALLAPEHFVSLTRPWYWSFQRFGVALILLNTLRFSRSLSYRDAAVLGVVSGATLYVNSVPVVACLALLAYAVAQAPDPRRAIKGSLLSLGLTSALLLPWAIRNYATFGALVPFRQNTWVEIRQGNNERGAIIQGVDSLHPNVDEAERARYRELGEKSYNDACRTESLSYVASHPGAFLSRSGLRAVFFWLSDLFHEGVYGDTSWGQKSVWEKARDITFLITALAPLSLLVWGIGRGWLRHVRDAWVLAIPILIMPIPYYISHIHPTYYSSVKSILILLSLVAAGTASLRRASS